jgi:hypothetical protein
MDRRRQPAMRAGSEGVQDVHEEHHWQDAAGFDHTVPRVLERSWALTRLVALIAICGLGAAATLAIGVAILVALIGDI